MFLGEYSHSIDAKGRVTVPSRYRDTIGDQKLVVTRGFDGKGHLVVYTEDGFREYARKWMELTTSKAEIRKWRRFVASTAEYGELDKQGRILLSNKAREHAGLDKDAVISGFMDNFEIWDPKRLEEVSDYGDVNEISKKIEDLDILI